jgi:hypothetical protein
VSIAIVGLGGIGSSLAFRLSDFLTLNQFEGLDRVVYLDDDVFEEKNQWLQHLGLLSECLFQNKAESLAILHQAKLGTNPPTRIQGEGRLATAKDLVTNDVVVSCVDTARFRRLLYQLSAALDATALDLDLDPYANRVSVPLDDALPRLQAFLTEDDLAGMPPVLKCFHWLDLRSTGKVIAAWTHHRLNADVEQLLATLPKEEVKAGCQTVEDQQNRTYQNGSTVIAMWGLQALAQYLRGEPYPAQFVYSFDAASA